jgi:hypothetical protein
MLADRSVRLRCRRRLFRDILAMLGRGEELETSAIHNILRNKGRLKLVNQTKKGAQKWVFLLTTRRLKSTSVVDGGVREDASKIGEHETTFAMLQQKRLSGCIATKNSFNVFQNPTSFFHIGC